MILTLLVCVATVPSAVVASSLRIEDLVSRVLEANPSLETLRQKVGVLNHRAIRSGVLPDPVLKLEASNVPVSSFDFAQSAMSGKQFTISQMIPFPGVLSSTQKAIAAESEAASLVVEDRVAALRAEAKYVYYDLAFLNNAIALTRVYEGLLRDFIRIAQSKYSVGRGLQHDVLRSQVALQSLQERLIGLEARREMAVARANRLLDQEQGTTLGDPVGFALTHLDVTASDLTALALGKRPMLSGLRKQAIGWEARELAAEKKGLPSFTISLGYRLRDDMAFDPVGGEDFYTAGLSLNLPVFRGRKQKQEALEAQAQGKVVRSRIRELESQLAFQLKRLSLLEQQHLKETLVLTSTIIPQAEQSLASARAGYEANKVDFLTFLSSQTTLFDFQLRARWHVAEHEKVLAEIESVVGLALFEHRMDNGGAP